MRGAKMKLFVAVIVFGLLVYFGQAEYSEYKERKFNAALVTAQAILLEEQQRQICAHSGQRLKDMGDYKICTLD
jgi:hypothetical protein